MGLRHDQAPRRCVGFIVQTVPGLESALDVFAAAIPGALNVAH